ncbi:2Fe-2S iron-sulfur cluster binding domain-containing protein [Stappia sp. GBMRC 2046]|uniref:2Fe-2S iron-sulfur cluster binding domain-containing protein n=1 Tax=Stappia sediminis TaxID=2692190 RepID=A0A7X3LUW6_9HYPH|nr:pyridoxamine 5'-phosphate oxidase family protein [Stappia sediminis]MXN65513.1 2Fe-2S iron-sulfur cluster binding domain-containing protein [Stappia sediminis]
MPETDRSHGARTPFHEGELAVQEKVGVKERIANFGRMAIRDFMPDQHRAFFAGLPFVVLSAVDGKGWPRATMLFGYPGFVSSPDARRLSIAARTVTGDPLEAAFTPGAKVGGIGIEFQNRRRNRFTAHVSTVGETLELAIDQSFGNCPQYIQTRRPSYVRDVTDTGFTPDVRRSKGLDAAARAQIEAADTFFIASIAPGEDEKGKLGADVSHRGGKPGFVHIDDKGTLTIPDFAGNLFFNTFGNLHLNPKTGLLFPDFASGDLLHVAGEAEIIYEGEEIAAFRGAERLLRIRVDHTIRLEATLPFRFEFGEFSPNSLITGDWNEAAAALEAEKSRNIYRSYRVARIVQESSTIRSFHLEPADGGGRPAFEAGQFLPIRLRLPDGELACRTYTLSSAPGDKLFRISVKREAEGKVSRHLHDHVSEGDTIEALSPRGRFTPDTSHDRPIVLISAGVGVTPMVSMLKHLVVEDFRTRRERPIYFINAARSSKERAFFEEVRKIASLAQSVRLHFTLRRQEEDDQPGRDLHSVGRINVDLLKAILPLDDYDFYICGPAGMAQSVYDGLRDLSIADRRIFSESFGESALKRRADPSAPGKRMLGEGRASVRFSASGVEALWAPESGTLLELAEAAGLSPNYGCRSGSCGSCAVRLGEGSVSYPEEPAFPVEEGMVLTCCAVPAARENGPEEKLVVEL